MFQNIHNGVLGVHCNHFCIQTRCLADVHQSFQLAIGNGIRQRFCGWKLFNRGALRRLLAFHCGVLLRGILLRGILLREIRYRLLLSVLLPGRRLIRRVDHGAILGKNIAAGVLVTLRLCIRQQLICTELGCVIVPIGPNTIIAGVQLCRIFIHSRSSIKIEGAVTRSQ